MNGQRQLNDRCYGILNAFDGGNNWINNINYHYWLGDYNASPTVTVKFIKPVSLDSIAVEGGRPFNTTLTFVKGGEEAFEQVDQKLKFKRIIHGVTSVTLAFQKNYKNQINEIKIIGFPPAGVNYKVGKPGMLINQRNAEIIAKSKLSEWQGQLFQNVFNRKESTEDSFIYIFSKNGQDLYKVVVDKDSGKTETIPLVKFTEVK